MPYLASNNRFSSSVQMPFKKSHEKSGFGCDACRRRRVNATNHYPNVNIAASERNSAITVETADGPAES